MIANHWEVRLSSQEDEECYCPVCAWVLLLCVPAPPPMPDPHVPMEEAETGNGEAQEEGREEGEEEDGEASTG